MRKEEKKNKSQISLETKRLFHSRKKKQGKKKNSRFISGMFIRLCVRETLTSYDGSNRIP